MAAFENWKKIRKRVQKIKTKNQIQMNFCATNYNWKKFYIERVLSKYAKKVHVTIEESLISKLNGLRFG